MPDWEPPRIPQWQTVLLVAGAPALLLLVYAVLTWLGIPFLIGVQ